MNEISERLKQDMIHRNLTVKQIASDLQISVKNVYRYMNGDRKPSNDFLYEYGKRYQVDLMWLTYGFTNNQQVIYAVLDDLKGKEAFLNFVLKYKDEIIAFLQGKTDHKETIIIKAYRNSLGLSRKGMRKLMLEALSSINCEGNKNI